MSNYTRGPWHLNGPRSLHVVDSTFMTKIAEIKATNAHFAPKSMEEVKANAQLIANAPLLLKTLHDVLVTMQTNIPGKLPRTKEAIKKAIDSAENYES